MTTSQIREAFLHYFEKNGHRRVSSSSLVPAGDPTLLFTNAGMNQFKDTFLGREPRDYARATTSQKCVRAGGKHNDLENVGRTARHHTFFEMLGNFSFGDYFKEDAIRFAWELMVDVYGLDPERLWFSVFEGDDKVPADEEAAALWVKVGAKPERVLKFGKKDNFWQMGDTGPCGPCSEIHYFRRDDLSKNVPELVNGPGDDTMEVWNLVFMQYDRDENGVLHPLPAPSVDTGMGLERISLVLQKAGTNYDTDLFTPIIHRIEAVSGHEYGGDMESDLDTAVRVLADHARASTFLISDGVIPSNEGRGYVLRRIIRRAIRFGRKLPSPVLLTHLVDSVNEAMGDAYPELRERHQAIAKTLASEEERFSRTLTTGMERVGQVLDDVRQRGETTLGGAEVFRLYDTFGIPIDLIAEMAEEEGVTLDRAGFEQMMADARTKAKASSKFAIDADTSAILNEKLPPTEFVGYDRLTDVESFIQAIFVAGAPVDALHHGTEGGVVLTPTPFYAESGGQIGDTGTLEWETGRAVVLDTYKVGEVTMSRVRVEEGSLSPKMDVRASVPVPLRLDTTANHTATHLLHKAMKDILGPTVQQAGSLVAPDRLRFDYTYHQPLSDDQIREIEDAVNEKRPRESRSHEDRDGHRTGEAERRRGDVRREIRRTGAHRGRGGLLARVLRRLPCQSHRRHRHFQDHVRPFARCRRAAHGSGHRPRGAAALPEARRRDEHTGLAGERRSRRVTHVRALAAGEAEAAGERTQGAEAEARHGRTRRKRGLAHQRGWRSAHHARRRRRDRSPEPGRRHALEDEERSGRSRQCSRRESDPPDRGDEGPARPRAGQHADLQARADRRRQRRRQARPGPGRR